MVYYENEVAISGKLIETDSKSNIESQETVINEVGNVQINNKYLPFLNFFSNDLVIANNLDEELACERIVMMHGWNAMMFSLRWNNFFKSIGYAWKNNYVSYVNHRIVNEINMVAITGRGRKMKAAQLAKANIHFTEDTYGKMFSEEEAKKQLSMMEKLFGQKNGQQMKPDEYSQNINRQSNI